MTARTDDYDEILRVMQLYIDGFNDNDVGKFREAFDEDAWIFFIDANGALHKNLISESFEKWAAPPSWGVVGRFISVTQVGDAAGVSGLSHLKIYELSEDLRKKGIVPSGSLELSAQGGC
jgi:ketosteroid isomerase-like protein